MKAFFIFLFCTVIGAFSLSAQNAPVRKVWDKTFGGNNYDIHAFKDGGLYAMLQTSDGGFLLGGESASNKGGDKSEDRRGEFGGDFWIVKTDANGNKLWDKIFGSSNSNSFIFALLSTADGGYLLGGRSDGGKYDDKSEDSRGYSDYWIVKIDGQGHKLWDKTFGGERNEWIHVMLPTADGGYLLGGESESGKSGDKSEDSRGGEDDYWVVKIDAQGNKLWDKTFGGSNDDQLYAMLPTADGGFLLGGISSSNQGGDKSEDKLGCWIVKIDAQGNKLWDKIFASNGRINMASSILPTNDGGYLLGGPSYDLDEEGREKDSNYWIVKIDAQGNKLWDKTFGGSDDDEFATMIPTADGNFLLGGTSESNQGGDKSEDRKGEEDFWIIKIAIEPNGVTETTTPDNGLKVYPNPSDGSLTISHPDNYTLDLFDAKGSLLRTLPVQDSTTELTGLASGLYLLRLTTVSGKTLTQKIVVN